MKVGLFTDSVRELSFEQALDLAVDLGVQTLEIGVGGQSPAPHLDLDRSLEDSEARKRWHGAIQDRGLEVV